MSSRVWGFVVAFACAWSVRSVVSAQDGAPEAPRLFMPDGQLCSHSVRVYVGANLSSGDQPQLRLMRSHAVSRRAVDEARAFEPGIVAPGQRWNEPAGNASVTHAGTLLMFDLSAVDFQYKPMLRVMPVLSWADARGEHTVVGSREVNLGNIAAAIAWTSAVVLITLALIVWLGWLAQRNPLYLLSGVDGHLSLAQTQMACWTVFTGAVVLGYGLIRLAVPEIPASLLVLMGASLTTGGIGYFQDKRNRATSGDTTPTEPQLKRPPRSADLLRVFHPDREPELSLAKAQMLFWTLLLLVLFLAKSILGGEIWSIPWSLVALMGASQAGFLVPKLLR